MPCKASRKEQFLGLWTNFDPYHSTGEADEGCVAGGSLVAAHGDALEALQLADGLLDAHAQAIKGFRKEAVALSYPLSGTTMRGRMSGPMSSEILN